VNTAIAESRKVPEALKALPAAGLYEAAGKRGDMAPHIRALAGGKRVAGFAFTLRTLPGDNLGVFHAINQAQPGDVLVIDAGGTDRVTIWGGTSAIAAQAKGIAGCVTNASIRDVAEIEALGFPVFAAGTSVRGATKNHAGWMNVPVCVGDVTVNPGDFIVGDEDGVVVIAAADIETVINRAAELEGRHLLRDSRLRAGESIASVMEL
jgi:4-hydroxy-4-methyl-2-oxoglutarate aldolase